MAADSVVPRSRNRRAATAPPLHPHRLVVLPRPLFAGRDDCALPPAKISRRTRHKSAWSRATIRWSGTPALRRRQQHFRGHGMLLPTTAWTGRGRPRISRDAKHSVAEKSTCCANLRRATRQRVVHGNPRACYVRRAGAWRKLPWPRREQLTIFARTAALRKACTPSVARPKPDTETFFLGVGIPMRQLGPATRSTRTSWKRGAVQTA